MAFDLYQGSSKIKKAFHGLQRLESAYRGNKLIWMDDTLNDTNSFMYAIKNQKLTHTFEMNCNVVVIYGDEGYYGAAHIWLTRNGQTVYERRADDSIWAVKLHVLPNDILTLQVSGDGDYTNGRARAYFAGDRYCTATLGGGHVLDETPFKVGQYNPSGNNAYCNVYTKYGELVKRQELNWNPKVF